MKILYLIIPLIFIFSTAQAQPQLHDNTNCSGSFIDLQTDNEGERQTIALNISNVGGQGLKLSWKKSNNQYFILIEAPSKNRLLVREGNQVAFLSTRGGQRTFRFNQNRFKKGDQYENILTLTNAELEWFSKVQIRQVRIVPPESKSIKAMSIFTLSVDLVAQSQRLAYCLANVDTENVSRADTELLGQERCAALALELRATQRLLEQNTNSQWEDQAYFYLQKGDTTAAERTLLSVQQKIEQKGDLTHKEYPQLVNNLGDLYAQQGKIEKASVYYERNLKLLEGVYQKQHPVYTETLGKLGKLYIDRDPQKAETYFLQAQKHLDDNYTRNHPQRAQTLQNLLNFYRITNDQEQARIFLLKLVQQLLYQLYSYYPSLDEIQRYQFLDNINEIAHQFHSTAIPFTRKNPALVREMANLNLTLKGLALESSVSKKMSVLASQDTSITMKYYQWLGLRRQLNQANLLPEMQQRMMGLNAEELTAKVHTLEQELSTYSFQLNHLFDTQDKILDVDSLRLQLDNNEAVIDFMHFRKHNGRDFTDTIQYCALITYSGYHLPVLVQLTNQKALEYLLDSRIKIQTLNYVTDPVMSHDLYQKIWEPLEPYLSMANIEKVHISPSGLLHQISFASLQTKKDGKELLMDKYGIIYHSSLREYLDPNEGLVLDTQKIVLIGGADFNDKVDTTMSDTMVMDRTPSMYDDIRVPSYFFPKTGLYFDILEGTKTELLGANKLLSKEKDWKTYLYTGKDAYEYTLKKHSSYDAPQILHIATHGYFLAAPDSLIHSPISPLLRVGLALNGANKTWNSTNPIVKTKGDGILTGYEIANLDLLKTRLVILSACETGLGDLTNSEGVDGLQRAFKSAGVQQMIVSLWKVPDEETAILMQLFYKKYMKYKSVTKAFELAQKEMRKRYKPYYWAGFKLIR
ncbi:MAG: CHAT domain-containing protein [Saprospiraceae bacterium]|nr:CHAT domain-containing protein [Saprospiraceae bacterium]